LGTNDYLEGGHETKVRERGIHFAYAFVDVGVSGERGYLFGGQLQHADFALLVCDLDFDAVDLSFGFFSL